LSKYHALNEGNQHIGMMLSC